MTLTEPWSSGETYHTLPVLANFSGFKITSVRLTFLDFAALSGASDEGLREWVTNMQTKFSIEVPSTGLPRGV